MENRVKFKIGEIEFEAEGSAEVVERERSAFMNTLLPAAVDAIVRTRGFIQENRYIEDEKHQDFLPVKFEEHTINDIILEKGDLSRTSLSSFIKNYGTLNDQDFALIAAYYDEKKNGTSMFSSEKVKQYYLEARKSEYSNNSTLLNELVKKGFIMDAPNPETKTPKQYILTYDGIAYVESYVPKINETNSNSTKNKFKKKTNVSSPQLLKYLKLTSEGNVTLQQFINQMNLKSNVEKTTVFVYFLQNHLNELEITIDHIFTCYKSIPSYKIPENLQQNLTDTASSKYGYLDRKDGKYSMSTRGINFVEHDLKVINI